jgi:hypothetical protein
VNDQEDSHTASISMVALTFRHSSQSNYQIQTSGLEVPTLLNSGDIQPTGNINNQESSTNRTPTHLHHTTAQTAGSGRW